MPDSKPDAITAARAARRAADGRRLKARAARLAEADTAEALAADALVVAANAANAAKEKAQRLEERTADLDARVWEAVERSDSDLAPQGLVDAHDRVADAAEGARDAADDALAAFDAAEALAADRVAEALREAELLTRGPLVDARLDLCEAQAIEAAVRERLFKAVHATGEAVTDLAHAEAARRGALDELRVAGVKPHPL